MSESEQHGYAQLALSSRSFADSVLLCWRPTNTVHGLSALAVSVQAGSATNILTYPAKALAE